MARLREDSEDEFPDLAVVIKGRSRRPPSSTTKPGKEADSSCEGSRVEPTGAPSKSAEKGSKETPSHNGGETVSASLLSKDFPAKTPARRQRALKGHNALNSKHFPAFPAPSQSSFTEEEKENAASEPRLVRRQSPKRKAQRAVYHEPTCVSPLAPDAESEESSWSADIASEGEEDSIVELDFLTRPTPMPLKLTRTPWKDTSEHRKLNSKPGYAEPETMRKLPSQQKTGVDLSSAIRSLSFTEAPQRPLAPNWTESRPSSSSDNDRKAILTL